MWKGGFFSFSVFWIVLMGLGFRVGRFLSLFFMFEVFGEVVVG